MANHTELMQACKQKNLNKVTTFLSKEPGRINEIFEPTGYTSLMYALRGPINDDIIKLLVDNNVDTTTLNNRGMSALDFALRNNTCTETTIKLLLKNHKQIILCPRTLRKKYRRPQRITTKMEYSTYTCPDKLFRHLVPHVDYCLSKVYRYLLSDSITPKGLMIMDYLVKHKKYVVVDEKFIQTSYVVFKISPEKICYNNIFVNQDLFNKMVTKLASNREKSMTLLLSIKHYDPIKGNPLLSCIVTLLRYRRYGIVSGIWYDATF